MAAAEPDPVSMRLARVVSVAAAALLVVSVAMIGALWLDSGTFAPAPSSSSPPWPFLTAAPAVYDAADGYDVWLLAGASTWTYSGGSWSNITATAGTPSAMETNVRMVYDATDGYVVLFGGAYGALALHPLADTWTFVGGRWTNLTATVGTAPPPGPLGLMTYDSEDGEVILFGGGSGSPSGASDPTWAYDHGRWTNLTGPGPPALFGGFVAAPNVGLADDPSDGYVLFYTAFEARQSPQDWGFRAGTWTNLTPSQSSVPEMLYFDLFAWDSTSDVVVAEADCVSTLAYPCAHSSATFEFRSGSWHDVTPPSGPSLRLDANGVDDPSDGGVLVEGGCCYFDASGLSQLWQDVWIFNGNGWHELEPWSGTISPVLSNDGTWIAAVTLALATAVAVPRAARPVEQDPDPSSTQL